MPLKKSKKALHADNALNKCLKSASNKNLESKNDFTKSLS